MRRVDNGGQDGLDGLADDLERVGVVPAGQLVANKDEHDEHLLKDLFGNEQCHLAAQEENVEEEIEVVVLQTPYHALLAPLGRLMLLRFFCSILINS